MNPFAHKAEQLTKRYLILLACIVGLLAGLGAVIFQSLVGLLHNIFFLRQFSFSYPENIHTPASVWGMGVMLLPLISAPVVIGLIEKFAYNEKGLSVPELMYTLKCKQGAVSSRVGFAKAFASSISLSLGGSIGREAPLVQLGAAIGAFLNDLVCLSSEHRVLLAGAGAAAGTAAFFNTPLGGIFFVLELMWIPFNWFSLFIFLIAVYVAMGIDFILLGKHVLFIVPSISLTKQLLLKQSFLYILLGLLTGAVSILFIRGLYLFSDLFSLFFKNPYVRHMVGMSLLGPLIYGFMFYAGHYYIEGASFATIQDALLTLISSPWLLLALFFGKLLATCLSLGTGASGGVFSPALFLGAILGSLFGMLCNQLVPDWHLNLTLFVIIGMAGMLGSVTGAVMTTVFIMLDLTASYQLFLPVLLTVIPANWLRKQGCPQSIYTLKLARRGILFPDCQVRKISP